MANFNKVILMGNLTRDPEVRYLDSGVSVANFGIAVNDRWTNRETGEQQEDVCFVDCEAWGRLAEIVEQYVTKGSPVHVEGRLKYDTWETEDGQRRSKLKLRVFGLQMLGRMNGNNNTSTSQAPTTSAPTTQATPSKPSQSVELADDIPF